MSFSDRPYAQLGIAELENLIQDLPERRATNEAILAELRHRKTKRAHILQQRLEALLASAEQITPVAKIEGISSPVPLTSRAVPSQALIAPLPKREKITNTPQDILRAWTAMEVLSPSAFKRPADLAGGDMRRIARFDRGLPWAGGQAKGPSGEHLYFQIVLGSIIMQPAIDQLLQRFADGRPEKPLARGETPLAIVIVDREGRPIADNCAVVSSFCWGLPLALAGDPASLGRWGEEESRIQTALHNRLYREGEDSKALPLDNTLIVSAYEWLVAECGLDHAMLKPPSFAVRSTVPCKSSDPPDALLLNSFFLDDLGNASKLFDGNNAPDTLRRFLGALAPTTQRDLLHDEAAIEEVVAPGHFPLGRWPGDGRHPLVLMQQAAVNLATAQKPGEILAVNGPPGTGKTTLLRDVVAALVIARASAMANFDDPESAFTASGAKLNLGGAWIHLYHVDPSIKGFEMLVASSNNKAVENVSGELPGIKAVAEDAPGLRYFKPMADGLLEQDSWGAIAAVLGNASNRSVFKERFWWMKETGLFSYFKAIDGRKPEVVLPDGSKRPPRIVSELDPPLDRHEALRRWQAARTRFRAQEKLVAATRERVERFRLHNRFYRRSRELLQRYSSMPRIGRGCFRGYLGSPATETGKRRIFHCQRLLQMLRVVR